MWKLDALRIEQLFLVLLLAWSAPAHADQKDPAQPAADAIGQAADGSAGATKTIALRRTVSLAELGRRDGVTFMGLAGEADLYFPVPSEASLVSLRLVLPYRSASVIQSGRAISVEVAGQPVLTQALASGEATGTIDLPVPPTSAQGGFVHVHVTYGRSNANDARCDDDQTVGAYFSLMPDGALIETLDPGRLSSVGVIMDAMPRAADIFLPGQPTEQQAAAAMVLLAANPDAVLRDGEPTPGGPDWQRAAIRLDSAAAPAVALQFQGASPVLSLGGDTPVAGANFIASKWRRLASGPSLSTVTVQPQDRQADRIGFGSLDADLGQRDVVRRASWSVSLPATSLPSGRRVTAVEIDAAGSADGAPQPAIVSVTMNGFLLGSVKAQENGPTHLRLDVPDGLGSTQNTLVVTMTRNPTGGDCQRKSQGFAAQLLPSSDFVLGPAQPTTDFFQLAPLYRAGVTVVVPDATRTLLTGTARVLAGLVGGDTPLSVSYGKVPDHGAYVWVGDKPPPDSTPPLKLSGEELHLADGTGTVLVSAEALGADTVVQLVRDNARPILWVRPGSGFGSVADGQGDKLLGHGDVAVMSKGADILAFSTLRDQLIDIRYPGGFSLLGLVDRYRLWLIAGGWLILSVGFVFLMRGVARARRSKE